MSDEMTPVMGEAERVRSRTLSLTQMRPPVRVPGYKEEHFLGRGAFGEVWMATDCNSNLRVAIKYYQRRGGLDWPLMSREVEKLRHLQNDRYVVQLKRVGWDSDPPYYVMEYMENGSLEDRIQSGPLPLDEALTLVRDVAIGLSHAHAKGILHCDLKPANVMLDQDGRARLTDFGQSRLTREHAPALGTLFYMAPEQADLHASPDVRWDIYALGALFYRLITGDAPYRAVTGASEVLRGGTVEERLERYRTLLAESPRPRAHRTVPGIDKGMIAIIDKCLSIHPHTRYHSVHEILSDLDALALRKSRRPLIVMGAVAPILITLIMASVGGSFAKQAIATGEREVVKRASDGNRLAAKAVADRLGAEVRARWEILQREATDPLLIRMIRLGDELATNRAASDELNQWVRDRHRYWDSLNPESQSSLWFVDDSIGYQRACSEPAEDNPSNYMTRADSLNQYFGWRDYFHGLGKNLNRSDQPAADPTARPRPIQQPNLSMVYRRTLRRTWTVAFSVPITDPERPDYPIGVLGMTRDLGGMSRWIEGMQNRFLVLIDSRPDQTGQTGLIVGHPYQEEYQGDLTALPRFYNPDVMAADEGFQAYTDPVGKEFPTYDKLWYVTRANVMIPNGTQPVNSGWIVIVQEATDEAVAPLLDQLKRGIIFYGTIALLLMLLVLIGTWGFVMIILNPNPKSRLATFLRRRAGLPAPSSSSSSTGSSISGRTGVSSNGTSNPPSSN